MNVNCTQTSFKYCIELGSCVFDASAHLMCKIITFSGCYCFWYVSIFYVFTYDFSDVFCLWFAIWNNIEQLFSFFSSKMCCFACSPFECLFFVYIFFLSSSPVSIRFFLVFSSFRRSSAGFVLSLHLLILCKHKEKTFYALLEAEFQLGEHNFWYCFNRFDVELKWFFFYMFAVLFLSLSHTVEYISFGFFSCSVLFEFNFFWHWAV